MSKFDLLRKCFLSTIIMNFIHFNVIFEAKSNIFVYVLMELMLPYSKQLCWKEWKWRGAPKFGKQRKKKNICEHSIQWVTKYK